MKLLSYITEQETATVKQAAEDFGHALGLARTTVQTMMERLRKKGYLERKKQEGVYHYFPAVPKQQVLREAVRDFVSKTLGGKLTPFLSYLTEEAHCTKEELEELKGLVKRLEELEESTEGTTHE